METSVMNIEFNGLEFDGLKFKENFKDFPCKNKADASKYLDNLYEEGGEYNLNRYKKLTQLDYIQRIHVALSYTMVFKILSWIFLGVVGVFGGLHMLVPGIVALVISLGFIFLQSHFNTKANDLFSSKDDVCGMIEFVFDTNNKL